MDPRAGALKTPRVPPLASIDIEIAWESPQKLPRARCLGESGFSHAISISMAQREALGHSWGFQSSGQRISASRKMRDPICGLMYLVSSISGCQKQRVLIRLFYSLRLRLWWIGLFFRILLDADGMRVESANRHIHVA